jgi:endonuclease YncB( thermonuclease family)
MPLPLTKTLITASTTLFLLGCAPLEDSNSQETNDHALMGNVVGVHDGDTVTILNAKKKQYKIRLACIDAPESNQDFGTRSKQSLSAMVYRKDVSIDVKDTDQYGRSVGFVNIGEKTANLEQVKKGMAWVYRKYCKQCAYYEAEQTARENRLGLWSQSNPIPPWEFRKDPVGSKNVDWSGLYNDTCPTDNSGGGSDNTEYQCGTKRYCSQMNSCDEAKYFYTQCGVSRLDRDKDGIPCESLCR